MEEGKADFTVLEIIPDHFIELELHKNLYRLLSLCVCMRACRCNISVFTVMCLETYCTFIW